MKMNLKEKYAEWMESGQMNHEGGEGLCGQLEDSKYAKTLELFKPTWEDELELKQWELSMMFWGSGLHFLDERKTKMYEFTPLRQTIVCFILAIHNEI